jgi:hypothetical protein
VEGAQEHRLNASTAIKELIVKREVVKWALIEEL